MPPQQAQPRSYRVPGERSSDTEKGIRTGNIEVVSSLVKYGAGNPILFGRVALKEGTNTTLTVDEAENAIQINSSGTGGSSKWTDGGTITYLTDTDDDLAIGGTDASSPFFWDYSATQLYVAHAKVGNLDGVVKASSGVLAGSATTDDLPEGATNKYFSNENIDDRVAALIQNGTGLTWTYDDVAGTLTGNVSITQYTDEMAQDAIGGILVDSDEIDFTYTDATPSITASIKADSIDDTMIDWGVGANQVNTDDIPEGSTNKFDETVSLTEGTGIDITGTYPSFTIASTVSPGTTDHAALSHLAYADAGHTGFEPTVTKGNLSEVTSSILTITGGTGAVIGSGVTIAVQQANATLSGYLSTTDWNTFNNKVGTETDPVWTAAESGYFKLAGRSGGQVAIGGTGAGDDLTLQTTSHATKGSYILSDLSDGLVKATTGTLSTITDNSSNWDTAYGWGDHSTEGYLDRTAADALYHRLDATNTPFTGAVGINISNGTYSLSIKQADRKGSGISISLDGAASTDFLTCSYGGVSVFQVTGTTLLATIPYFGTTVSASTGFLAGAGSAASPSISWTGDTNTGFYSIGADNLGISIGGTKKAEWTSAGNLLLTGKLALNDTSAIDAGVQLQILGDVSNNANLKLKGVSGGFFYYGFNDTYNKAAMSVSNGTTTTWDALDVDHNGNVLIGYSVADTAGAKLDVYDNTAGIACRVRNNSTGDILNLLSGGTTVLEVERYGKVIHTASSDTYRSYMWLRPPYVGTFGNDGSDYWSQSGTGTLYMTFDIPDVILMGGTMRIMNILVRMTTTANGDYITQSDILRINTNAGQTAVWSNTTDYAKGVSGSNDYTIYASTGITLSNAPHQLVFTLTQVTTNGVRIRGVRIMYDRV
jgi:hypothetical protein